MLLLRCGNGGVGHSPHETVSAEDADIDLLEIPLGAKRLWELTRAKR